MATTTTISSKQLAVFALIPAYLKDLYFYRSFLSQSVSRDLKKRYKRSVLGYVWSMLNPLMMMIVLSLAFSKILGTHIEDYPVFLFVGMLSFQFFSQTVTGCLGIIANTIKIIDQIPAPKYLFPTSVAVSNLINLLLSLVPLLIIAIYFDRPLTWTVVLFPLILLPLFFASVGFALIFSVANVFFEDTQHLTGIFLQCLYFLSPILYGPEFLPDQLIPWIMFNPIFYVIEMMRDVFFHGQGIDVYIYFYSLFLSVIYLLLGLWVFHKADQKFVYFI